MQNNQPNEYVIKGKIFREFISYETIQNEVTKLANRINSDYKSKKVLFIIVMKGSIFFAADLMRQIELDCEFDSVRASSYGKEMKNAELKLCVDNLEIEDRHVIVIEDIIDTGNTLSALFMKLKDLKPKSLEAVSFLSKPDKLEVDFKVKYIAMEIPPAFVIGYGLDYDEKGRNLPCIYSLIE